jgi:hypothetical protein
MTTVYRALDVAGNIADNHDVLNSFLEIYTMRREYENVFESVEYTMEYLGLYDEWYNAWVKSCDNV